MPAKSKKQQRFFALVHAYKNGKIKHPSESVRRAAESISDEDARHFAATSHSGLPEKAAEFIRNILSEKKAQSKFFSNNTPVSAKDIAAAEKVYGSIPRELLKIIKKHNGATWATENPLVDSLVSYSRKDPLNALEVSGFIPKGYMPIANDGSEGYIAVSPDGGDVVHVSNPYLGSKKEKLYASLKDFLDSLEKKAWTKTPVRIQNRNAVYDFESLEEACQYLASIGTLSYDDVEKMLQDREGLINGFQIVYSDEKTAEMVDIDPGHRQNAMLRARRIADTIASPEDNSEDVDELEKDRKDKKRHVDKLVDDIVDAVSVSGDAVKTISNLLNGV